MLARNYAAYTLEITPSSLKNVDETIDALAEIVDIQPDDVDFARFSTRARISRAYRSARASRTRKWPGSSPGASSSPALRSPRACFATIRMVRWPCTSVTSSYQRPRPEAHEEREQESTYRGTDHIGKIGNFEQSYEAEFHGITGFGGGR